MIEITINGDLRSVDDPLTIADLLAKFAIHERMVVVERNGDIVPRAQFAQVSLAPDDRLEIVQMMAGG